MLFRRKHKPEKALPAEAGGLSASSERTVLGPGWQFKGRIYGKGDVVLQSAVEGELDLQGSVSLETRGAVKGMLRADEVRLNGRFEGRLEGKRLVALSETARLAGDVATPRLQMAEGANLNGRVDMERLTRSFTGEGT